VDEDALNFSIREILRTGKRKPGVDTADLEEVRTNLPHAGSGERKVRVIGGLLEV
jgi:hypothetical protein